MSAEIEMRGQVYGIIDPDYGRWYTMIRKLAWEEGYAIGMHGSFTRDLDLMAVPWAERTCDPEHLVRRICSATALRSLPSNPGAKPHGRLVWTLVPEAFGDPRFVDLSIMPLATKQESADRIAELEAALAKAQEDARRYSILRRHSAPAFVAESMDVPCPDLPDDEAIESRIDSLCDAALRETAQPAEGGA